MGHYISCYSFGALYFQLVVLVQYLRHKLQALVVRRLKSPSRPLSQVDEVCYSVVFIIV